MHSLLIRQRDELDFVARHFAEMAGFPFGLRLLDAFLARGHKIPPDMTWSVHTRAAEDDKMCIGHGSDHDGVSRFEYQQASCLESIADNIDDAVDHVDRPFLVAGVERKS